uniref:Uncharacterized protein n=1 Tax=Avena sativa TaxID=4498 RepID=A0ACD5VJF6_AVESA
MAAVAWKPLFWERFRAAFVLADHARGHLAAVFRELASPLGGGDEGPGLSVINRCGENLAEASRLLAIGISGLGTVEVLARRCTRSDDTAEIRARARARAARAQASDAYEMVLTSRGHIGAAARLVGTAGIPDYSINAEQAAVLAAVQAAVEALGSVEAWRTSDARTPGMTLPRADSRMPAATAAPNLVGANGNRSTDAAWSLLGGSVPGPFLRVALSGALTEIEAAHAALQVGADAVDKSAKGGADADWSGMYAEAFLALDAAHSELSFLLALEIESALVFLRCAPELGVNRGALDWTIWEASRADAERHGRAALDYLWSASAVLDYCFSGVLAWGASASTSAGQQAQELMRQALADAAEARGAGDNLRHAAGQALQHGRQQLCHQQPRE